MSSIHKINDKKSNYSFLHPNPRNYSQTHGFTSVQFYTIIGIARSAKINVCEDTSKCDWLAAAKQA
jgi:hypothetical protein